MPRSAQWPPKVLHHKPSGQDRIRVKGRDYYLGPHDSPQARAEYARLLAELLKTGQAGPAETRPHAPGLTVLEVLARWHQHARQYYSGRGREIDNIRLALEPVERLFGMTEAASFDVACLRRVQQAMCDGSWMTDEERQHPRRKNRTGWARGVVNRRTSKVRMVWRWAEEEGKLVPPGSWAALRALKPLRRGRPGSRESERSQGPRTTSLAEVKRVCKCAPPPIAAMLLVQWWTGMRTSEVRIMKASDVRETAGGWIYQPREHKTDYLDYARIVFLGPRAMAALNPWLKQALAKGPDAAVFPSPGKGGRGGRGAGSCYTLDGYCHAVRKAARAAGLPHFHSYLSRHATRMRISRECGDEAARAVLGQRWLDTTLRYGEIDLQLAGQAQQKLG